jgi:protein TonB
MRSHLAAIALVASTGIAIAAAQSRAAGQAPAQQVAPGVIPPKVKKQINPRYTSAAMRLKIQGHVVVDAVVLPDGTVGRSRIHTSLDKVYGLDDEALAAVNRWTFEPGTLNGKPVAVVVTLVMEFRLH